MGYTWTLFSFQDFRATVDNAELERPVLPPQLLNQILKYLPELYELNKGLLRDLKERISKWYVWHKSQFSS